MFQSNATALYINEIGADRTFNNLLKSRDDQICLRYLYECSTDTRTALITLLWRSCSGVENVLLNEICSHGRNKDFGSPYML